MVPFSIVITAYNRENCISRAINSADAFLYFDEKSEIIVVDDGSGDNTVDIVEDIKINNQFRHDIFLLKHPFNKGVCAAKNTGARAARGSWIIFLDSDDELMPESYSKVCAAIKGNEECPIHFFSCLAENQVESPGSNQTEKINFSQYIENGTGGEKLPVLKKSVFSQYLYDEDMPGYEGLAYMRIIKMHGGACIHGIPVRRYYTSNQDRLSARSGLWKRSGRLAIGHLRVLSEHHHSMGLLSILMYGLRFTKSMVLWGLWCLKSK
jgi:glycosyltransferase involved in cell wall biosynthesis